MPWRETCSMREKARFCVAYEKGEGSMSEPLSVALHAVNRRAVPPVWHQPEERL